MTFEPYPAWRFGPGGTSVVVYSPEDDSQLGSAWSDQVPEDFQPKGHPTYMTVAFAASDSEGKEDAPARRKPGRPPKVQEAE